MMSCFVVRRVFNELLIIVNGNSKNDYLSYPRPVDLPFNSHSQKKGTHTLPGFFIHSEAIIYAMSAIPICSLRDASKYQLTS